MVGFAGLYGMLEKELWKSEDITGTAYELITYLINFHDFHFPDTHFMPANNFSFIH